MSTKELRQQQIDWIQEHGSATLKATYKEFEVFNRFVKEYFNHTYSQLPNFNASRPYYINDEALTKRINSPSIANVGYWNQTIAKIEAINTVGKIENISRLIGNNIHKQNHVGICWDIKFAYFQDDITILEHPYTALVLPDFSQFKVEPNVVDQLVLKNMIDLTKPINTENDLLSALLI